MPGPVLVPGDRGVLVVSLLDSLVLILLTGVIIIWWRERRGRRFRDACRDGDIDTVNDVMQYSTTGLG